MIDDRPARYFGSRSRLRSCSQMPTVPIRMPASTRLYQRSMLSRPAMVRQECPAAGTTSAEVRRKHGPQAAPL